MPLMSVTLDVSKLSGWLNADANGHALCRAHGGAYYAERGVGEEAGGRGPAAAHERHAREEGPAVKAGGALGHVQSDLRAAESKDGHATREEVRPGRREGARWRLVCTGRARLKAVGARAHARSAP